MSPNENPPEAHTLDSFKTDPRLAILQTIIDHAKEISSEFGQDAAYPPGHPQYSPFFPGQFSMAAGDNLQDLLLVIQGRKSLAGSYFTRKVILAIQHDILAAHKKLIPLLGESNHQQAVNVLEEIASSSEFDVTNE